MDITRVDLNLLAVFDVLLRECSVTRTAETLGVSQPAVSYALNRLRRMLGDPLFVRIPHGLQPTPHAARLAQPLRTILDGIREQILLETSFTPARATRVFTLNMSDVGELVLLPKILRHVREHAPGVDICTDNLRGQDLEAALQSGDVDLAVGFFPEISSAGLYQQRLFSHSFVCIVRNDHPTLSKQLTRKQFLEGEHAVVHVEGRSHEQFEETLRARGLSRRVVLRVKHYLALPALLEASDLIFTVPYAIAMGLSKVAQFQVLELPFAAPRPDVKQYWHRRLHADAANKWLRGVVAELFLERRRRDSKPAAESRETVR
ncbi:MAG TPA: LysR family transcriptional regulator [Burkholderiaceae bacterium]|nr:LysR family transcriptional regulator [Burkholderiaceae bacterium]